MNVDFIEEYKNVFTKDECKNFIKHFEDYEEIDKTFGRKTSKNMIDDKSCLITKSIPSDELLLNLLFNKLSPLFAEYVKKYEIGINQKIIALKTWVKIQKTLPGQGYHGWHPENISLKDSARILSFIVYLNTVKGGETEFIYQNKRVEAEEGKLVVFPAYFTHAHRGNPPLNKEKYILTSWLYKTDN